MTGFIANLGFSMTSKDGGHAEQMSGTFIACVALICASMHFLARMTGVNKPVSSFLTGLLTQYVFKRR